MASDCYFENITFENTYGYRNQSGPQALALMTAGDRTILNHCTLRSFQDTYLTRGSLRAYLYNCRIEGAVDFIYGNGDVFFDHCLIYLRRDRGYIVAPDHRNEKWGYVFSHCTIDGDSALHIQNLYFGRPWHNNSKAVFLHTICKVGIAPIGWHNMGTIPAVFADYGSVDANGKPLDINFRKSIYCYTVRDANHVVTDTIWGVAGKNFLTPDEAAAYTIKNVLGGKDGWNPKAHCPK
jgi:pectin methylesterase-like acyl-CoA thioesterase